MQLQLQPVSERDVWIKWELSKDFLVIVSVQVYSEIESLTSARCKEPFIFDYNFRISWSIFIILPPMETEMNIPQSHVFTYLIV